MGGFPGFSMMGQQRQKGDALKEYVSFPSELHCAMSPQVSHGSLFVLTVRCRAST